MFCIFKAREVTFIYQKIYTIEGRCRNGRSKRVKYINIRIAKMPMGKCIAYENNILYCVNRRISKIEKKK